MRESGKVYGNAVDCSRCGAKAGEPCFTETVSGEKVKERKSHYARRTKARWEGEFQ